ncbi:cyclic nucleotide-binding domain-containing protein [Halodurantibacterium flavum]|uniref:Cyclic nucleotide-binding domain-containing protein n=1 Tax=Halodurantibacterium flavum TaxID=1382802 RepID=A0ABW4RZN7_9RHOB
MLLNEEVNLLRHLPIFQGIDLGLLKLLCLSSPRRSFAQGDVLFREGEPSSGAYVILSGSVEIRRAAHDRHTVKTGSNAGAAIVGQSSLLRDTFRLATVVALTDVEALHINGDCFLQLVTSCAKSSARTMHALNAQSPEQD